MAHAIRNWLLRQLNSRNVLDGVTVTVKLAAEELGAKNVAAELRKMAKQLENNGSVKGWKFPHPVRVESLSNGEPSHVEAPNEQRSYARLRKRAV